MPDEQGMLRIDDLVVRRGGAPVIGGVSLEIPRGQIVTLLGANGAGKSTLLDAVAGAIPARGSVVLDGRAIGRVPASARARSGLGYIEQGRTVFADLTVEQNLLVVAAPRDLARAWELFPELDPLRRRRAELLSGGQQQMLMIARAVLCRPRYLLVDELSLGLAPTVVRRLLPVIRRQADEGAGVLLVEQFADAALACADTAYVLARGAIAFAGSPGELRADPARLRRAYLGGVERAERADDGSRS